MYTLTYTAIYISIYEIKKFVLPCYVFLMFFFGCKNFIHIQKKLNKKDNENNIKQNKQRKLCTANNYIQ